MKTKRVSRIGKALRRVGLAVLALLLCEIAAALPEISESARLGLAVLGYFSFVLLLRAALLSWRRDWEDLWLSDIRRQAKSPTISSIQKYWKAAS